jgi:hypothetical protein
MRWRTIITDTEGLTGVGPECPHQADHTLHSTGDGHMRPPADDAGVYDCCPLPHLECYSTVHARELTEWLNAHEIGVCD